jgi:hypothetical protein
LRLQERKTEAEKWYRQVTKRKNGTILTEF